MGFSTQLHEVSMSLKGLTLKIICPHSLYFIYFLLEVFYNAKDFVIIIKIRVELRLRKQLNLCFLDS